MKTQAHIDPRFLELFVEHMDYVGRTLRRLGCQVHELDDACQEVFLVVHRRLSSYDPSRPVRPWLFGIARLVVLEQRRKHARRVSTAAEVDGRASDPGYRALESADLVYAALAKLDEPLRVVLVLRDLEGVAPAEAAEQLGLPIDTFYGRLRRARDEFRRAVTRLQRGHRDG